MTLHKKKAIAFLLAASLTFGVLPVNSVQAATTLKLSDKSITITVGKNTTVTANKKITNWKSSNKTIATVKKITNKKARITGRKKGSCKITATSGKKAVKLKVTVRAKATTTATPTVTNTPVVTSTPLVTNTPATTNFVPTNTTETPVTTATPSAIESPIVSMSPTITEKPVVTEKPATSENPAVTEIPETTATSAATKLPTVSTSPTVTEEPVVTTTPMATTTPAITATPGAVVTTSPSAIVDSNKVQASFSYTGNNNSTLTLINDTTVDFQFQTNVYYLEQKTADDWMSLPAIAIDREPISAVLKAKGSISYSVEYLDDYGTLTPGTYRIVVPLSYTAPNIAKTTTYFVKSEFTIEPLSSEKFSIITAKSTENDLSVTLANNNTYSVQLNQSGYTIEMLENGIWTDLPSVAVIRDKRLITIAENSTDTFSINYTEYYGALSAGTYRILFPIWQAGNDTNCTTLYVTFTIN